MAPNWASNWYTWHDYNIEIKKQSLHIPIDPSHFHQCIWTHLDSENIKKHTMQFMQCSTPCPTPNHHHWHPSSAPHKLAGDPQPTAFSVETPTTAPENALPPYKSMAAPSSSSTLVPRASGVMDKVSYSASPSMVYLVVTPLAATGNTGVPYAGTPAMGHNCAHLSEFHPIITPLMADAWE
ncbi:hypothetical protein P691DRAFT_768402 [Macrolepiota fuliginosa MF-IS2]|uniref:Uncharacterized protein n=1 Tax=Macrolepiota fuliginosa MF-IS2 TaxID=1400762 RepID=A0A9P6BVY9_9AGAR|nr:hypothetical protein P691DRAFT_768402 [Macrolepiota fuliginosa MF-IS2]